MNDLVRAIRAWCDATRAELLRDAIDIQSVEFEHGIRVDFDTDFALARVTTWNTGMSDSEILLTDSGQQVFYGHREHLDASGVPALMGEVLGQLQRLR